MTGKDWNAKFLNGAGAADILAAKLQASDAAPKDLVSLRRKLEEVVQWFEQCGVTPDLEIGEYPPFPALAGRLRFRRGEVTIWTGYNHHGKSEMIGHLMVSAIARGEIACIASMETPPFKTFARVSRQATGQKLPSRESLEAAADWAQGRLWLYDHLESGPLGSDLKYILGVFADAAGHYNVTQFVIDNLAALGIGEEDWDAQKAAVLEIEKFALTHFVHVHLVAHPRKAQDESRVPGKLDVRGGGVLTDLVNNVIAVWRNVTKERKLYELELKQDPHGEIPDLVISEPDAVLTVHKQKETGETPSIKLWFHRGSLQFHDTPFPSPTNYVTGGPPAESPVFVDEQGDADPPAPAPEPASQEMPAAWTEWGDDDDLPF